VPRAKLGRTAHAAAGARPDHSAMDDRGLHRIEDELGEHWLTRWIDGGIAEIEAYLAKHAAFLSFLDTADSTS